MDASAGLKLPMTLQALGLSQLRVENEADIAPGGSLVADVMRMSADQLREKYLATGVVTAADIDGYREFATLPETWAIYYATVGVTARKI